MFEEKELEKPYFKSSRCFSALGQGELYGVNTSEPINKD